LAIRITTGCAEEVALRYGAKTPPKHRRYSSQEFNLDFANGGVDTLRDRSMIVAVPQRLQLVAQPHDWL
jgi:hypothetical protein